MTARIYDLTKAEKSSRIDVYNKELLIVKVKTGRWLLCEEDGTVKASKRSQTEILDIAGRLEVRRMQGNLHGFRFGSKIDESVVLAHAIDVWGERFEYSNVHFDGHYWFANIAEKGRMAEHLRMDYHINYERLPEFAEVA